MENFDYLYDKTYFEESYSVEHFTQKELSYKCYENAYIVPMRGLHSGVYAEDKNFVESSALHNGFGMALSANEFCKPHICDETVIYLGVIFGIWGHVLTDDIKRFWFLKTASFLRDFKNYKLLYIKMSEGGIPDNAIKFFNMLGVNFSQLVEVSEITQYKKVIIPDECFFSDENGRHRFFTKEYKELIQSARTFSSEHFVKDDACDKLYFTYSNYKKGNVAIGEKKLENFFKNQGYRIVSPEKYTFEEQLNMLANCHHFASTIGSCAHNLIFLPEKANVILIPRAHYLTGYQLALDSLVDLNVNYIDSSLSVLVKRYTPWTGPFYFYVSENLLKYFNHSDVCDNKYYKKQLKDFKKYFKRVRLFNDLADRYQPEYYSRQFAYCMGRYRNSNKVVMFLRKVRLRGPIIIKNTLRKKFKLSNK